MNYLLDTSVLSELRRRHPDPAVLDWYETVPSAQLFLSVLTIGEIRIGIERLRRKDPVQADALEWWYRGLRTSYQDHVVGIDVETAQEWAC
ncbi:MAG TPA: PIN domain-containing protein [Streptosporangiaceae bacterium]